VDKKFPSNGDVITSLHDEYTFPENLKVLQTKFPTSKWENCSVRVLRTKIFRLKNKVRDLKRNKKSEALTDLLSQDFDFPVPKIELPTLEDDSKTQKLNYLVTKTKDVVYENRQLKRELAEEQEHQNNLNLQISHYEKKVDLLFNVLESCTLKQKNAMSETNDVKVLEKNCRQWEKKYKELSEKLDKTLESLDMLKEKVKKLDTRNTNKKLKRRDEKIESQRSELIEKNEMIRESERRLEQMREENERKDEQVESLKREKRNLLVRICRLNKKQKEGDQYEQFVAENAAKIIKLKDEIQAKEEKIIELGTN
jgi:chromosome segregation ATPase